MDLINNLVFTALDTVEDPLGFAGFPPVRYPYFDLPTALVSPFPLPQLRTNFFSYDIPILEEFAAVDDPRLIDNAIQKHWADMVMGRDYKDGATIFSSFNSPGGNLLPPYHLVYAYLVENTRISQIFERTIYLYMNDEKLNKATTAQNRTAFQWMINTESLFYRTLSNIDLRNVNGSIRPSAERVRRNAYYRLLGMDLAFGDIDTNADVPYYKAEANNQSFIVVFESFLRELWQAYINAKNTSGVNTTDMFIIVDTARKLQEMLMARRTTEINFDNYRYFNLSREEYAAVVMMSWFYQAVSYDSPIVQFLRCNGNSPGERIINIGNKVGLPAHSKSEGLLDIAPPMNTLLRLIELGEFNPEREAHVRSIIEAEKNNLPQNNPDRLELSDLLLIINNWEKATGHRIKNPEANVTGTVRIQPNGVKPPTDGATGGRPYEGASGARSHGEGTKGHENGKQHADGSKAHHMN
jgi:hypothetical protein